MLCTSPVSKRSIPRLPPPTPHPRPPPPLPHSVMTLPAYSALIHSQLVIGRADRSESIRSQEFIQLGYHMPSSLPASSSQVPVPQKSINNLFYRLNSNPGLFSDRTVTNKHLISTGHWDPVHEEGGGLTIHSPLPLAATAK